MQRAKVRHRLRQTRQRLLDRGEYEAAVSILEEAVAQGDPEAQFAFGDCYYPGNGVEQDLEEAANWYQKALAAGYEPDDNDQAHLKEVLGEDYAA